jgi:Fe-S-cluster containining protein
VKVKFSREVVHDLLVRSTQERLGLEDVYALLPATHCKRTTLCCALLPEIGLMEALAAIQRLAAMEPAVRLRLSRKLVRYFFVNPVEITSCPFLEGRDCLIYEARFFCCRAYGLWSRQYYEKQAACSREAKEYTEEQWRMLGVSLPATVLNFHVPYCPHVEVEGDGEVEDEMLLHAAELIEVLSRQLAPWHGSFYRAYFSDLSFLLASLAFGPGKAIQMKFSLVRHALSAGDRSRIDEVVAELPDVFAGLA